MESLSNPNAAEKCWAEVESTESRMKRALRNIAAETPGNWQAPFAKAAATNDGLDLPRGKVWYIAMTAANGELTAIKWLRKRGFTAYSPIWSKTMRRRAKEFTVERPLFSRYVFVGQDPQKGRFVAIEATPGVSSVLKVDGAPVTLPEAALFDLRAMEVGGCFVANKEGNCEVVEIGARKIARPVSPLGKGDDVRIVEGPFSGHMATVMQAPEGDRIQLLVSMFGQSSRVEMQLDQVATENRC